MRTLLISLGLLLLLPTVVASDVQTAPIFFRAKLSQRGGTLLMPVLPMGILVEHANGPAIAPGELVSCRLRSVEGILTVRCGSSELRFAGIAVNSE